jgi:hypothetical protein
MASSNVNDYAEFRKLAARFGGDLASWAAIGIGHRTEQACEAERANLTHMDRADRGRYSRLLAAEVARACASRAAWESVAREAEKRITEFEAALAAERRWPALQAQIQRRRPAGSPASSIRATVAPPAPPSTPARPAQPGPGVVTNPIEQHAADLDAAGLHFSARAELRALAEAEHEARRRRVEQEVSSTQRLFETLVRNYGRDYAERFMEGA